MRLPAALVALVAGALALAPISLASGAVSQATSSNWAGYVASGTTFSSVVGSWKVSDARCNEDGVGSLTASAFWVGLGGESASSDALEQAGTESDCSANGVAHYEAWYELVPAASVRLPLAVSAGDTITAAVAVKGTHVTLSIDDRTSGKSVTRELTMAGADVSSAEWIAEAPSVVTSMGDELMPLTDFGTVDFSGAEATSSSGHTGAVSDDHWQATRVDLETASAGPSGPQARTLLETAEAAALPSALKSNGAAFDVVWSDAFGVENEPAPGGPSAYTRARR